MKPGKGISTSGSRLHSTQNYKTTSAALQSQKIHSKIYPFTNKITNPANQQSQVQSPKVAQVTGRIGARNTFLFFFCFFLVFLIRIQTRQQKKVNNWTTTSTSTSSTTSPQSQQQQHGVHLRSWDVRISLYGIV